MTPPPTLQELIETVRRDAPSADLVDLLVTASSTVHQIEDTNDALLEHFVDQCRRAGRSWSEISAALGVSKQAVHKRYSAAIADRLTQTGPPTFERFTPRARAVLVAADRVARARGRERVGGEDLLLGLYSEPEGLAARALVAMQVGRDQVGAALGAPTELPAAAVAGERLAYAPDGVDALRDALAEALELSHNYLGTEHLLLGLLRAPDAPAAVLLARLGASQAETRVRLAELLRELTKGAQGA